MKTIILIHECKKCGYRKEVQYVGSAGSWAGRIIKIDPAKCDICKRGDTNGN